ncbi:hypothetical protein HS088_TW09G00858 [Tripterygium wilfordii]|uniref:Uncharacterized protein n=1 Tax=Tripterygium wilfordii TaxID=458696 RepID=A0A7J7D928_TRIWF|nr:hypothetical protein HS088_TW09G00858 [Tripterygium wilfordii]
MDEPVQCNFYVPRGLRTTWTMLEWTKLSHRRRTGKGQSSALRSLEFLTSLAEADWKSYSPPLSLDHCGFRFWVSGSSGKCPNSFWV